MQQANYECGRSDYDAHFLSGSERLSITLKPLLARPPPPPSYRWVRSMRSWAGDIDGGDLMSEISSEVRVEYVNVDITPDAGMSCDRILVSSCCSVLWAE